VGFAAPGAFVVPAFPLLSTGEGLPPAAAFGVERRLFGFGFFEAFFDDFLAAFFAAGVFFAAFFAFFATRLLVFVRFFCADDLVEARRGLRAFFGLRFLTVFFLGVATTVSFLFLKQDRWG